MAKSEEPEFDAEDWMEKLLEELGVPQEIGAALADIETVAKSEKDALGHCMIIAIARSIASMAKSQERMADALECIAKQETML